MRNARRLWKGRTIALAICAVLVFAGVAASAQIPSVPTPSPLPSLPVPLPTKVQTPVLGGADDVVNDVITDVTGVLPSGGGQPSGGGSRPSSFPSGIEQVRRSETGSNPAGGGSSVGPAVLTRRTLSGPQPGYGTIAGRAAERAAGRALRLAGPFAPPLGLGAIAFALLLFLSRGSQPLVKFDPPGLPQRRYRL